MFDKKWKGNFKLDLEGASVGVSKHVINRVNFQETYFMLKSSYLNNFDVVFCKRIV